MANIAGRLELGVILCKHCLEEIGTLDTERVQTFYSDCQGSDCLHRRTASLQIQNDVQPQTNDDMIKRSELLERTASL